MTDAPAERRRVPFAALGFAAAAALSSWSPLSAPLGLVVGVGALVLALRARRAGYAPRASAAAAALAALAALGSALVLALTAGVGKGLQGEAVVPVPPGVAREELDAAAERTRAARERARRELDALDPARGAPAGPEAGKGGAPAGPEAGKAGSAAGSEPGQTGSAAGPEPGDGGAPARAR